MLFMCKAPDYVGQIRKKEKRMDRYPTEKVRFSSMEKAVSNPYIGFTSFQRFRGEPLYSDIVVRPENHGTET